MNHRIEASFLQCNKPFAVFCLCMKTKRGGRQNTGKYYRSEEIGWIHQAIKGLGFQDLNYGQMS
jgi:hypothetical protein